MQILHMTPHGLADASLNEPNQSSMMQSKGSQLLCK